MNIPNKFCKVFKIINKPNDIFVRHSYKKPIFHSAVKLGPEKGKEKEMHEWYKAYKRNCEIYSAY